MGMKLWALLLCSALALISLPVSAQDVVRLKIPLEPRAIYSIQGTVGGPPVYSIDFEYFESKAWGFIDETGKVVIPPQWDAVADFHEGRARVSKNGKSGFIDENGKVVVELLWGLGLIDIEGQFFGPSGCNFSEGLAVVERDKKYGFIDRTGKLVVPLKWDFAWDFHEGLAAVGQGEPWSLLWGFIDQTGKVVVKPQWDKGADFEQGRARVEKAGARHDIDKTGKEISGLPWRKICLPSDGLTRVITGEMEHQKNGFIDASGKVVIKPRFLNANDFYEGLAAVQESETSKYGFIDKTGSMVIPPRWQDVKPFSCGLAAVDTVDYKTGFIDKTGKVVVEPIWDGAYAFEDGLCWVYKRSKHGLLMGVIDTTGKVVVPPEWKEVTIYHGYIFARRVSQSHQIPITGKDLNYHESFPAEAAWFDKTGKMIWHSTP